MRVAVLVFVDFQLGGIGTQAHDFARLGQRIYGCGKVISFTRSKASLKTPLGRFTAKFGPARDGKVLRLTDSSLSLRDPRSLDTLSLFDVRIWMGVAPHVDPMSEEADFFAKVLSLPGTDVAFATDRFIGKMYPWIIGHLHRFDARVAFADAYARAIQEASGTKFDVVPIAPLGAWERMRRPDPHRKTRLLFWPHQWRGWKNIGLFLRIVPGLPMDEIEMFGAVSGYEYAGFKRSASYEALVRSDESNPSHSGNGKLVLKTFHPHETILSAYEKTWTVPDFTGVSETLLKPNSYIGNYQCATLEAMALGCPPLKMDTTLSPHSCIPKEAVLPLSTAGLTEASLLEQVTSYLKDRNRLMSAAVAGQEFVREKCAPETLFRKMVEG